MDGIDRFRSRIRIGLARAAAIATVGVLALLLAPGTASAAGTVTPIFDCYRDNGDGTFWAVLGYTNTAATPTTIPYGARNQMFPGALHGSQPTTFQPGTVHGAVAVRVTPHQVFAQNARWVLDGRTLQYSPSVTYGTVCPASTQLPATGNGWGWAMGLGAAAVVGAGAMGCESWRRRGAAARVDADGVAS